MPTEYDFDLIVIGAGIAGFVSAVTANGIGKRVAVIEKRKLGGNCTNLTCIPSKALVRLGHLGRDLSQLRELGILKANDLSLDKTRIMEHVRSIVQKAYEKDLPETFESIGIRVLMGHASFIDNHHISLNGETLSAGNFMVATGTRPVIPAIPGLSEVDYLTNENLYELDRLPDSLIILGGGVDGLEYASALGRIGLKVTVIEMFERLLPMADRELVNKLLGILRKDGIDIISGARAVGVRQNENQVTVDYEFRQGSSGNVSADRVLVAIGRRPDFDGLELNRAGVAVNERGVITDKKLRTTAPNIYACGDIVGPYQLASMAEYQGITAAGNMFAPIRLSANYDYNISIIFTDPPLAFFGLTEEQAHKKYGHKLKVYRFDYSNMRRAIIDGTSVGGAKFLCDGRGRLVGVHILGEAAGEVIHEAQMLRSMKKPLYWGQFVTHAYPTYAQALVGRASQLAFLDKMSANPLIRAGLWALPGFKNRLATVRDRLAEIETDMAGAKTSTLNIVTDADQPSASSLSLKAKPDISGACVIDMPAEVMDQDETAYLTLLDSACSLPTRKVILDFSKVTSINGLGACLLLKLILQIKKRSGSVYVMGMNKTLSDVLRITELDQITINTHISNIPYNSAATDKLPGDMSGESINTEPGRSEIANASLWARPADELYVNWVVPGEARNLNVSGRRAIGPVNGFGPLWQKTYRLYVDDPSISPEMAVRVMKENFPAFQPSCNKFYPSAAGIGAGEIVLIDSMTPGGPVSTGVMVMYADDNSFTFVTPQGHPEAGWVSFSAHSDRNGTVAQICGLARAGDPIFEAAFRLAGSKMQIRIWTHVLRSLATFLGVPANVTYDARRIDASMQWNHAWNVKYNAQIITLLNEPFRWFSR